MKKINCWLLASLFTAALTLTACGSDDDDANNNGGGGGGEPTLTINDLTGTTWEVWADKEKAPNVYQTLEIGADNTFKLHQQKSETEKYDYTGTWVEKDGTVLLTYSLYSSTDNPVYTETEVPLHFSRYGNGVLLYTDRGDICEVFVRHGETLNVSGASTAGHELLGKWKGSGGKYEYTFNADGTCTGKVSNTAANTVELSTGLFIDIPASADNGLKRFITITHVTTINNKSNGTYRTTTYQTGGNVWKYTISDGKLYFSANNKITTMEDLLKVSPYTKVTEE